MTPASPRFDFDADERQFLSDAGLPADAPWHTCPPLTIVLAADEGVLPADVQAQVAGHVAECAFCRSLVHDAKEGALGAPTDEEHDRIRARVRSQIAPPALHGPVQHGWRWWSAQGLALAAALVAVVALGWFARMQQQKAAGLEQTLGTLRDRATQEGQRTAVLEGQLAALRLETERPGGEPNVPVVDLEPIGSRRNSDSVRGFGVRPDARFVTLILQIDGTGNAGTVEALTLEIRDARGDARFSIEGLRASSLGVVTVLVPRSALPDGEAAITLLRLRDSRRATVAEYRARFDRM